MSLISIFKNSKLFRTIHLFLVCNLILSCATKEIIGELVTHSENAHYEFEFDFSHPKIVREQIRKIGPLNNLENQQKLVQLLVAFTNLNKHTKNSYLKLLPHSKTLIQVNSFCASSSRAAPVENEKFRWVKGSPDIQLIREVTTLFNENTSIDKSHIQELIWNLENKTYYEDYPEDLKRILTLANPNAKFILPNHLKSRITNQIIPAEIEDVFNIIEGEYHTVEDFKKRMGSIKSKSEISRENLASTLPTTQLTAKTKSKSYESQTITFFNSTNKDQDLKITDYFLKPVREDVQPIILSSVLPYNDEIKKILEESALKMLGYIASQYPTLNSEEKALVRKSPIEAAIVFYNAIIAEQRAESIYPNSRPNGESDAFRHFVWSGLLTRDIGEESAREFLNAHETTPNQPPEEKSMDEFNNELGIRSAKAIMDKHSFNNAEFYDLAKKEINDGNLRIINRSGPKK